VLPVCVGLSVPAIAHKLLNLLQLLLKPRLLLIAMLLILLLNVVLRLSNFRTGSIESVRTLCLPGPLKGRVALFNLLAVLIFDVRVQLQDVLDEVVEKGVDVLTRLDHRFLNLN